MRMDKRSQVYRRMSASYIMVVFLFVVIIFVGYFCSYRIIRDQALFYNEKLLETIKSVCDREMEAYYNNLSVLNYDEELRNYVSLGEYQSPEARVETHNMVEKMREVTDSLGDAAYYCKWVFLYLKQQDRILCMDGYVDLEEYSNQNLEVDVEELRQTLQEENREKMIGFQRTRDGKYYILLHNYLVDKHMRKGDAVVGMWLDLEALAEKISSVAWNEDVNWAMVDGAGNILACSKWLETALLSGTLEPDTERITVDGREYLLNREESDAYNWQFVLFTNRKNIGSAATRLGLIYFACALVLLLVGYESVRILMKLHYSPIKKLVNAVSGDTDERIGNEYQFLENRMAGLVDMHKDAQRNLSKSNRAIRDYLLEEMLSSSTIEKKELAICEEIYSKYVEGENLVIICTIPENEKNKQFVEEEQRLNRYIVSNVYAEEISAFYSIEALELDDYVVMLVNIQDKTKDYGQVLRSVNDKSREFLKQHYQFDVCMFVGNCHPGVEGIHSSYLEACEAVDRLKKSDAFYVTYREAQELPLRSYDYSFGMEERLYNAVRSGNEKQACSYVEIILKNNFSPESGLASDVQTCLLYDIYGTLLKASEEAGVKTGKIVSPFKVFERGDVEEIRVFFYERVRVACDEIAGKEENAQWKKLCQNVMEYICENYTNPDLNLAQTALHFNLTPAYLASNYKKQTGSNIADTIKEMRIEHSKVLLKEDLSIREIAERVGFRESSTFVRFFKNHTGMTPGQMRKMDKEG